MIHGKAFLTSAAFAFLVTIWSVSLTGCRKDERTEYEREIVFPEFTDEEETPRLPQVYLTTEDGQDITSKEEYVTGHLEIRDSDKIYGFDAGFSADMRIRGRGNASWHYPKKPYKIKLNEKAPLINCPKDKDWCLLAEFVDRSFIRNVVGMELSRICGMEWTPAIYNVEVYMNGRYDGIYCLSEHKKVSKHRIDIDTDAGDILFEVEAYQDNPVCWWTAQGLPVMFSDPEEPDSATVASAKKYFAEAEVAIWSGDFSSVTEYLDTASFINNYIIEELTKNYDGNLRRSSLITLKKDGVLELPMVWDFDIAFGNFNSDTFPDPGPEGWWVRDYRADGKSRCGWYWRLFQYPEFRAAVTARWTALYPSLQGIPSFIDQVAGRFSYASLSRNEYTWPRINFLLRYGSSRGHIIGDFQDEVEYLKTFYSERLAWLNGAILSLEEEYGAPPAAQ